VHNVSLVYLCLSISTCFGLLWFHHQEIQLCLCDTCHLLFCVDDCLVFRVAKKEKKLCTKLVYLQYVQNSLKETYTEFNICEAVDTSFNQVAKPHVMYGIKREVITSDKCRYFRQMF
jgi:hypothetical protein